MIQNFLLSSSSDSNSGLVNKLPEREHNYTFENIPNKLSTQQAINRNLDDISTPSFLLPKKTSSQNEISTGDNLLEIMGLGEMDKTVKRKSSSKSFTSSSHSVDTPFIASSTQSKKDEVEMPSFLFKQDSTGNIPGGRRRRLPPPDEEKRRSVLTLDQPLKSDSNTGKSNNFSINIFIFNYVGTPLPCK